MQKVKRYLLTTVSFVTFCAEGSDSLPKALDNKPVGGKVTLIRKALFAIGLVLVCVATASAQTSNGTIIGSVTDATGGAIVGATVTVVSADTDAVRTTQTNGEGTFRIESLLPGTYNVSA